MVRNLKKRIHVFIPEDSGNGSGNSSERNYIKNVFFKKLDGYSISTYPLKRKADFDKEFRDRKKYPDDKYYILKDTDLKSNKSNFNDVKEVLLKYAEEYPINDINEPINLVLSARSWEVWMCMHNRVYTRPFTTQGSLNIDVASDYDKSESWYNSNTSIYSSKSILQCACTNTKTARNSTFPSYISNPNDLNLLLSNFPKINDYNLNILLNVPTFSYVDLFIEDMLNIMK